MARYVGQGSFEAPGDTDWVRVFLEGGQVYSLNANGLQMILRNAAGEAIAPGYIAESGLYFVEVRQGGGADLGWTVELASPSHDDGIAASPLTTRSIALGETVSVHRDIGYPDSDDDWFAFDADAGKSYQFKVTSPETGYTAGLSVVDAGGHVLATGGHFTAATGGRYYVAVEKDSVLDYSLKLSTIKDDFAETIATRGKATVGGGASGALEGVGDRDWFAVTLTAGHSYTFTGDQVSVGIADKAGALLTDPTQQGLFTAAVSGKYFLTAESSRYVGAYHVALSEVRSDLADNVLTTGRLVADGAEKAGRFESFDDSDWYAVQVKAGTSYHLTGGGSYWANVYDAQGHDLTGSRAASFTATADGTYYIGVTVTPWASSLDYTIGLAGYVDDYAGNVQTTGRAVVGQAVTSHIDAAGDTDWFAIDLSANVTYRFRDSFSYGILHDATGATVAGYDYEQVYTPRQSGTYYLELFNSYQGTASGIVTVVYGDLPDNTTTTAELARVTDGTAANDRLIGGDHADRLTGMDGDDTLLGGDGDDVLAGDAGKDQLVGGAGNDRLNGGDGDDVQSGGSGDDELFDYAGNDTLTGGLGNDFYWVDTMVRATIVEQRGGGIDTVYTFSAAYKLGDELENLYGFEYNQTLTGNAAANRIGGYLGNDVISGAGGADLLYGSGGADRLLGGLGDDTLSGGSGDDVLTGGIGADLLTGYTGADRFVFARGETGATAKAADTIADFVAADGDRIDLTAFGALSFVGAAAFSGRAGEVHTVARGGDTVVEGDLTGDARADFAITLTGAAAPGADAFVFASAAADWVPGHHAALQPLDGLGVLA